MMKNLYLAVIVSLALFCLSTAKADGAQKVQLFPQPIAPALDVKAWALIEFKSGMMVAGMEAETAMAPASITKLMTNYVVYEALKRGEIDLSDQVLISEKAWRAEGSRMFAEVNSKVSLEHLLKSTAIQSGNDAAIALAEHVAGSEQEFVLRMNKTAKRLGMTGSTFVNSTGLPDEAHQMSAHDIAKLSRALIRDYPKMYQWYSDKEYTHNNITQRNRNRLLWKDNSIDGIKTGHTNAAGYCLSGSAIRNGERWIAVVLGARNQDHRENAVMRLLDFGFKYFTPVTMLDEQNGVASVKVYKGNAKELRLKAESAVHLVVPKGKEKSLRLETSLSPYYSAPLSMGEPLGVATISLGQQQLIETPLLAMSNVSLASWYDQIIDSMRLQWHRLVGK